jgi:ribosomal protein S18 acetylase RimI-like enzyme
LLAARGIDRLRALEAERWAAWPHVDEVAVVAENTNGQALGALVLVVHEYESGRVVGYRLAVGVEESARGRGVGRRLIDYAKRYAAKAGADYLYLQVDPANESAFHLYLAEGFEQGDPHGLIPMVVRFRNVSPE